MPNKIEVDCSIGPVGAVISGVDLSKDLEKDVVEEIHQAWLKHHIVFFRDQDLTPPQQAAFGELFGELDTYPFMKSVDSHPNVIPIIKEPETKINFGGAWHTDSSYKEVPPKATLLYAIEVPKSGGKWREGWLEGGSRGAQNAGRSRCWHEWCAASPVGRGEAERAEDSR